MIVMPNQKSVTTRNFRSFSHHHDADSITPFFQSCTLSAHRPLRNKVCGKGPGIVVDRVSKVVNQVLQWTLSSHNSLNEESEHGEHSKSAIFELLNLALRKSLWVISKAQWVKAATRVQWVNHLTEWPTSNTVTLNGSHQNNLDSPDGQDALCMDQAWVAQVVESTFAEDL